MMEWTTAGFISYIVLWVVVVIQIILTLALARLVGQLNRRIPPSGARVIDPGPEIGEFVGSWEGVDLLGNNISFEFPGDRGLFLLYISPHCSSCTALLPAAKHFFKEISNAVESSWVMVMGNRDTQLRYVKKNGLTRHPVLVEKSLPPSWRVKGAPFGLWIDSDGFVKTKGMVNHREHLESLWNAAKTGHASYEGYATALTDEETSESNI